MFSRSLLIIPLLFSVKSYAILDFLAEEGKKTSEVIAYSTALSDLITEIDPNSDAGEYSKRLNTRIQSVQSELANANKIGEGTESLLEGPDLSNKRVLDNIKSLTLYLRRVKGLMVALGALGTQGAIAINTAETNRHLSEIQKNQQTQLLLLADAQVKEAERTVSQRKKWDQFLTKERDIRGHNAFRKH